MLPITFLAALFAFATPAVLAQASTNGTRTSAAGASTSTSPTVSVTAPTVSGTACAHNQENFNACVIQITNSLSSCHDQDWLCLCQNTNNLAACYNQCDDLSGQGSIVAGQASGYCASASAYPSANAFSSTDSVIIPVSASATSVTTGGTAGGSSPTTATGITRITPSAAANGANGMEVGIAGFVGFIMAALAVVA